MGRTYKVFLDDDIVFVCRRCKTHLATKKDLSSRNFQGVTGRAYLFDGATNLSFGEVKQEGLRSGNHEVAMVFCNEESCG